MPENLQAVLTDEASEMASAKEGGSRQRLAAAGGILGAIAASACCIVPLTLIVFGVSGAWMANLRAIAPYQPILIVMTIAVLGYGFYLVYWKPKTACADGAVCARPVVPNIVIQAALWLATVIVALSITLVYWFPIIVPYLP
jgi:mercuric ion transport protein